MVQLVMRNAFEIAVGVLAAVTLTLYVALALTLADPLWAFRNPSELHPVCDRVQCR